MFSEPPSPLPRRHAANDEARAGNKYASKSLGNFLCIHSLTSTRQVFRERETKRRRSLREGPLVSRGGAPSHPSNDGLIIHGDEHRTNRSARGGSEWGVAITQTDATRCHVSASVAGPITAHLANVPPEADGEAPGAASPSGCFTWVVLGLVRRVAQLNVKVHVQDGVAVLIPRDCGEGEMDGGFDEGSTTKASHFTLILLTMWLLGVAVCCLDRCHGTKEPSLSLQRKTTQTRKHAHTHKESVTRWGPGNCPLLENL